MTVETTTATEPDPEPDPRPNPPARPRRPARRLWPAVRSWSPWAYAVAAATILFVVVYGRLILDMHASYSTQAFDFGIFDQGLWLLSRFDDPFVTLRGLHLFGDHASLIMVALAPLFWVWDDPRALLLFTVAALAAGGPIVYASARRLELPAPVAAALGGGFLLYPALTWATWWNFHPELVAIPMLIGSFLLSTQHRPKPAAALLLATLLVKEDAALVVVPMALWLGLAKTWSLRQALVVAAGGIAFFVLTVTVILPAFTPDGRPDLPAALRPLRPDAARGDLRADHQPGPHVQRPVLRAQPRLPGPDAPAPANVPVPAVVPARRRARDRRQPLVGSARPAGHQVPLQRLPHGRRRHRRRARRRLVDPVPERVG